MEITLATGNPSKAHQIQTFFAGSSVVIKTPAEAGIEGEVVEDGGTLEANARKKVAYVHDRMPEAWVMSDDTGLFITAFDGEPGVEAAYWGGAELSVEERMRYCLKRLANEQDRSAVFRTTVVVMAPSGVTYVFTGEVPGTFLETPRVPPQPKMPYSSIFVPERETQSWAEMDTEYENCISHRGRAFQQVRAFLESR